MPSEHHQTNQAYLYNTLVKGTKPFRYRSGIRILLGRPETPETQLSYPLPLPPAGFRYLQNRAFDPTAMPQPVRDPADFFELPLKAPQTERPPLPTEKREERLFQNHPDKQDASSMRPPVSENKTSDSPPVLSSPQEESSLLDKAKGETIEMKIDIPGLSEKVQRFPAIAARKNEPAPKTTEDITPKTEEMRHKPGSDKDISDPGPMSGTTPPVLPHLSKKNTHLTEKTTAALKTISASQNPFFDKKPGLGHPQNKWHPMDKTQSTEALTEKHVLQNASSLEKTDAAERLRPNPLQHSQSAAETQIAQLRQNLQALKRKTASPEIKAETAQNASDTSSFSDRQAIPATQKPQVVIVKQSPVQRQSPAAFWERNYMSHLFRLRPLR